VFPNVFTLGAGATAAVGADAAELTPLGLLAVTTTWIVFPVSAPDTTYVVPVAPEMSVQVGLWQDRHCRENVGAG
jgi:hypothetical protein